MKEEKALLAGEMSGHLFFADRYFGYDDAIYASARLLEIISLTGRKISEILADVPRTYSTPEIRRDCPDRIKFGIVEKIRDYFQEHFDVITVDGVRILFADGWGLIRASNTQPVLVLRFEAATEERLREIRGLIEGALDDHSQAIPSGLMAPTEPQPVAWTAAPNPFRNRAFTTLPAAFF